MIKEHFLLVQVKATEEANKSYGAEAPSSNSQAATEKKEHQNEDAVVPHRRARHENLRSSKSVLSEGF